MAAMMPGMISNTKPTSTMTDTSKNATSVGKKCLNPSKYVSNCGVCPL